MSRQPEATAAPTRWTRRSADALAAAGGLVVVLAGMVVVRNGHVPAWERSTFNAVNGLPEAFYPVLWPFQQVGNLVVGPLLAIAALIWRRYRLACALLAATVLKLAGERLVKSLVTRERPGTSIGSGVEMRGDVHAVGESFVSGHAVMVAAVACLIAPYLPRRWRAVPWVVVAVVMVARVYVGAHNPLDVICGAALGVAVGSGLNLVFAVPAEPDPAAPAAPATG